MEPELPPTLDLPDADELPPDHEDDLWRADLADDLHGLGDLDDLARDELTGLLQVAESPEAFWESVVASQADDTPLVVDLDELAHAVFGDGSEQIVGHGIDDPGGSTQPVHVDPTPDDPVELPVIDDRPTPAVDSQPQPQPQPTIVVDADPDRGEPDDAAPAYGTTTSATSTTVVSGDTPPDVALDASGAGITAPGSVDSSGSPTDQGGSGHWSTVTVGSGDPLTGSGPIDGDPAWTTPSTETSEAGSSTAPSPVEELLANDATSSAAVAAAAGGTLAVALGAGRRLTRSDKPQPMPDQPQLPDGHAGENHDQGENER